MSDTRPQHAPDPGETLRLDDALKLAGVASTGGEAKMLIQGGSVMVNGAVETRRKRKLVEGDVVEVGDETFEILLADVDDDEDEGTTAAAADGSAEAPHDREPIRAPGAGDLEEPDDEDEDEDDGGDEDDDEDDDWDDDRVEFGAEDDAVLLGPDELAKWAVWIEERVADDDVEAVIIRLGSLHPDALEAVFALLPTDVEERVLDGLDAVLDGADEDGSGGPGDLPLQA
jgi:ribosome-associated protein